ncbi:MAG: P22 coat protein - protein 5 domain protein [Anaerolineales bacterium]|jgi:hypothetical protein|nr:P22 coat protein - protein 5 domain protein [Anaerolineales bacterium]
MAIDNFIPTIWSARLLESLQKAFVYGQPTVVNRDYEGEIRDVGDKVRINTLGPVSVVPYSKNSDLAAPETLTDASQDLEIDQADAFNFQIDDIDRAQQRPKIMDAAMRNAAYALADATDQHLASVLWQGVATANVQGAVGTPVTIGYGSGETQPYLALLNAAQKLDEANVPRTGRWAIVPPWFHAYLLLDARFVGSGAAEADARGVNGLVGRVAGFDVFMSNNVPYVAGLTEYKIVCGTSYAAAMAEQINKVEAYRPEKRFADAVKGLHLYGAKVVYPEALALIIADAGSQTA